MIQEEKGVAAESNELDACGRVPDLQRYLDGELQAGSQSSLFSHMADCGECRSMMESVLVFRRMIRQEFISLPPAADDVFFSRLAELKQREDQICRSEDRSPLWNLRKSISLRTAVLAAVVVFIVGLLFPTPLRVEYVTPLISTEVERVSFPVEQSVMYVFYPGIDVIASRPETED